MNKVFCDGCHKEIPPDTSTVRLGRQQDAEYINGDYHSDCCPTVEIKGGSKGKTKVALSVEDFNAIDINYRKV